MIMSGAICKELKLSNSAADATKWLKLRHYSVEIVQIITPFVTLCVVTAKSEQWQDDAVHLTEASVWTLFSVAWRMLCEPALVSDTPHVRI
jgi:hypothetical protein